jgi:hypothetical protein
MLMHHRKGVMSKLATVHFEYTDNIGRSTLLYENGDSEKLALTVVGENLRRLDESSFLGEAVYGDVIRVREADDGAFVFIEVAQRTTLVSRTWIMSADTLQNQRIKAILASVMEVGGMWEQAFGGMLMIHVPPEVAEVVFQQLNVPHV